MEKIEEFNGEAEKAGDDGDVEKAMEFMDKAKALKAGLDQIIEDEQKKIRMNGAERKLIICEICANFMSSKDNDERMQDHCEALPPPPLASRAASASCVPAFRAPGQVRAGTHALWGRLHHCQLRSGSSRGRANRSS